MHKSKWPAMALTAVLLAILLAGASYFIGLTAPGLTQRCLL